jgi:hypothetical protein
MTLEPHSPKDVQRLNDWGRRRTVEHLLDVRQLSLTDFDREQRSQITIFGTYTSARSFLFRPHCVR